MSASDLFLLSGGTRLGGDEPNADRIPSGLQFSSSWQGGFKTLECTLMRTASASALERMYGPVRLVDRDGQTIWQGELRRPDPRSVRGSHATHSPAALGLTCRAEDREDVQWIGVNRDLSIWQGPKFARMEDLASYRPTAASAQDGRLMFDISGAWELGAATKPYVSAFCDVSPMKVGRVAWSAGPTEGVAPDQWIGDVIARLPTGLGGVVIGSDWITSGTSQPAQNLQINANAVELGVYSNLMMSGDARRRISLTDLHLIGDHGLPLVGATAATWGIRASDAIPWLITQFSSGLSAGFIPETPFALPHCGQFEPGTLGEAVNALNAFHGYTSAVWEHGEWDFHPYGSAPRSRSWKVTAGDRGVEVPETGNDGSAIWSGVVVYYSTPDGQKMSVGPPGSLAGAFDSRLQVTDPLNPAVAEGRVRWKRYDLGVPANQETATLAGAVYAAELNQARRAGTVTVEGFIYDADTGEPTPAYRPRGGDWLTILGVGDDEPHRLLDASYADGKATLTLDDGMQYADVLLAHIQGQLTGRL